MKEYKWKIKMRNLLFIFMLLIGLGFNAQAQQTNVEKPPQIYVLGNVTEAKMLVLTEFLTLTQAIEKCGGMKFKKANFFKKAKNEARIYRIKPNSKERTIITIDFGKIIKGVENDVRLVPYDIIEVTCPKGKRCYKLKYDGLIH